MTNHIHILGTAMITPVGLHTAQSCASVRAGIMRFGQLPWQSKKYNPFVMASIPDGCLPPTDAHVEQDTPLGNCGLRMLRLIGGLQEELQTIAKTKIPLIIGLPQNGKLETAATENYLKQMAAMAKIHMDPNLSKVISQGRASGLLAVIKAIELLESGTAQVVLAGGCDTYKDLELLSALDIEARLKSETNRDGFVPGEGAGLLLLTNRPPTKSSRSGTGYRITATATGFETGHIYSQDPYRGEGLSRTFGSLFKDSDFSQKIGTIYSTMNGESYWVKEWGVASIRYGDHFAEDHGLKHPADCYGDLGAASGPVMAGLAMAGMENGSTKGPALVYASSDHGKRAAVIIDRIQS